MKKILFLNYEYPPLGGGAGVATEALLKEWSQQSLEVHLVTAAVGKTFERIELSPNVTIHRLPIGKSPKKLHSQSMRDILVFTWKALCFLWCFVPLENQKKRFDVTLAFFTIPCGALAHFVDVFYKVPYVVSLRGADVPGFSEKYDHLYFFLKPIVKHIWHHAKKIVPNSTGLRDLALMTAPKQVMEIIENGVDTETFHPGQEKSSSPIIFLSTSRLTPRKGIDKLVEAFAVAVKYSKVPLELHLIGEGEQKESLGARVQELGIGDTVKFIGRVEHSLLPQFYRQAHVFVLPSKNEGMSNAALEAMASGLPLVVSATGGMEELVTDGQNGLFIDPDMTVPFAETLVSLANNQASVASFGAESRRRAELRGWDKVAEKFINALAQSIKK